MPGNPPQLIVTTGALHRLTSHQLDAVLTHERGHARARHDWLLHLSTALATGFPRVPLFSHFCDQTHRLVELAADDTASRRCGHLTTALALIELNQHRGVLSCASSHRLLGERVDRLLEPPPRLLRQTPGADDHGGRAGAPAAPADHLRPGADGVCPDLADLAPQARSCFRRSDALPDARPQVAQHSGNTAFPTGSLWFETCHPPTASETTPARARPPSPPAARGAGCARTRPGSSPTCCATSCSPAASPDGVLPHEDALGADYRASRNTVRQALDLLRAEGLVERLPGRRHGRRGREVPARPGPADGPRRDPARARPGHQRGPHHGPGPRTRARSPTGSASRRGTDVLYVERLRRLNGLPLSLDLTYIPLDIGTDLLGADLENTDVFRAAGGRSPASASARRDHPGGRQRRRALRRRTRGPARRGRPDAGTAHPPGRRPPGGPGVHPLPRRPHHHERPAAPRPC